MAGTQNPFVSRTMVPTPAEFFGREAQLARIWERLREMESTSIVGDRRVGKSSVLRYVATTGQNRLGENYRFVYLDHQHARLHDAASWVTFVLAELGADCECISKEGSEQRHNLHVFGDRLKKQKERGLRIVLCLDELERMFERNGEFDMKFFDHMRAEINARNCAFITATERRLDDLCAEGRMTPRFHSLFDVVELEGFSKEEAWCFVDAHRVKAKFSDDDYEFIGRHFEREPVKLQILCDWVVRNRYEQYGEEELLRRIREDWADAYGRAYAVTRTRGFLRKYGDMLWKKLMEFAKTFRISATSLW